MGKKINLSKINLSRGRDAEKYVRAMPPPPSGPRQRRIYLSTGLLTSLGYPTHVQLIVVGVAEDQAAIVPCAQDAEGAIRLVGGGRYLNSAVLWNELELQAGYRYPTTIMRRKNGSLLAVIEVEQGMRMEDDD